MKIFLIGVLCFAFIVTTVPGWAAEGVDENEMFSEENTVVAVEKKQDEKLTDIMNLESVTFSGDISGQFGYDLSRDYLKGDADPGENPYTTSMEGDFLLDVRLRKGVKAFGDLGVSYSPKDDPNNPNADHFQSTLKEFFAAANITHKVYFQFGKQTLKWGQGYFWNPTDLISSDRRDFKDMDARREGVYGLKMHVPFGTRMNLYSFLNASGANTSDEFALAGKIEVLLPHTIEVAASAWAKSQYMAVYGLDFRASPTNKTQVWGELALSYGDNQHRLEWKNDEYVDTRLKDTWVPRVSVGLSRTFNIGNINDRLTVAGEFYHNGGGYTENMLQDTSRKQFLDGGYFESNNYGKSYAALFTSLDRFLVRDMTLSVNSIGNLSDSSVMVRSGMEYQIANNATFSFDVTQYLGPKNREFTLNGNAVNLEAMLRLSF
jgi:hypothetical protein